MSLDVTLTANRPTVVFTSNITHNLATMARMAGVYEHLWRPGDIGITTASQLIEPLEKGLEYLILNRAKCSVADAANGWGTWADLVAFVREYLAACRANPDATVSAWR